MNKKIIEIYEELNKVSFSEHKKYVELAIIGE